MDDLWAALMLVAGGLFAGGAATFSWSRVPIWRRMPLREFGDDFEQTLRRTDKVQPALLMIATVAAVAYAISADGSARLLAALGAGAFVLVLVASLAVMVPLQRRIVALTRRGDETAGSDTDVEAMRLKWFSGNLGRSVLSVAAYALLVSASVA